MPRICESCRHVKHDEIDRKLKAGASYADVSRWLRTEHDTVLSAVSIGHHAKEHLGAAPSPRGRRPVSADFLESVRDAAADGLASGALDVTLKDGIAAQKALDARAARDMDRDWQLKLVLALTGRTPVPLLPDPEVEAIEGEFRPLLESGV